MTIAATCGDQAPAQLMTHEVAMTPSGVTTAVISPPLLTMIPNELAGSRALQDDAIRLHAVCAHEIHVDLLPGSTLPDERAGVVDRN